MVLVVTKGPFESVARDTFSVDVVVLNRPNHAPSFGFHSTANSACNGCTIETHLAHQLDNLNGFLMSQMWQRRSSTFAWKYGGTVRRELHCQFRRGYHIVRKVESDTITYLVDLLQCKIPYNEAQSFVVALLIQRVAVPNPSSYRHSRHSWDDVSRYGTLWLYRNTATKRSTYPVSIERMAHTIMQQLWHFSARTQLVATNHVACHFRTSGC